MKIINVTCAIIEQHERVLVTQRSANMDQPLLWEFPGGKLEPGEAEGDGLVREIKEELGIAIKPIRRLTPVVHKYPDKEIMLIPYICQYLSGGIRLTEHLAYQWAERDYLTGYNWCPADVPIVEEYLQQSQ